MATSIKASLKRLAGALSVTAFVGGMFVNPSSAVAADASPKLIAGIDETASEYWAEYLRGVNDIAQSVGTQSTVIADNYQGDQLLAQLGAIYAGGCKQCSLVTNSTSNAYVKAVVDRSARAGVYVVTVWNRPENLHPWDTGDSKWIAHTSFDGVQSGYLQGMALCKALNGKGQIAAIEGVPSTPPAFQRMEGLKKALAECPGMKLVDTQVGEWQETKAQTIARTWLARYGDSLNGIFASNDSMARGAVAALREKQLNGKVFVTGSDGSKVGLDMVKSGDMLATVWNDAVLQGAVSMALAHAAAVGDVQPDKLTKAQRDFYLKQEVVTKDNVDHFLQLKASAPNYTYSDIKKDFWKESEGAIPAGANAAK
ncbi:MAG TPA: sugar ABC transporter substrate-binding protein [Pararobbsia sp.]|nr:sugar ABC transporter substrate-binding protein [Pararobbsia sp.]